MYYLEGNELFMGGTKSISLVSVYLGDLLIDIEAGTAELPNIS